MKQIQSEVKQIKRDKCKLVDLVPYCIVFKETDMRLIVYTFTRPVVLQVNNNFPNCEL